VPHPAEIEAENPGNPNPGGAEVGGLVKYAADRLLDILDNTLSSPKVQAGIGDFLSALAKRIEKE